MMKVSLGEVYMSTAVMNKLIEAPLSAKLSFRLARVMREMNDALKTLEEERTKLIKKFGKDNGDGSIAVTEENKNLFLEEFNTLLDEEIETSWDKIEPEVLGDTPLSVADVSKIGFLFKQ